MKNIRNFSIIAHIDHGKSTLADRLIEFTHTVNKREMRQQVLDDMDLEREKGITIKAKSIRLHYKAKDGNVYLLNLIDTPGHVDFTYEVSRSLSACEGTILVVDACQGVEAQTFANMELALSNNLKIIPVINKIDLPNANIEQTQKEIEEILPEKVNITKASAKLGKGTEEILERIVNEVPPPKGNVDEPLSALIFDSVFDLYRGAVIYIRIIDGIIKPGMKIAMVSTGKVYEIEEVGVFLLNPQKTNELCAGDVGYIIAGIKDIHSVKIGDTITDPKKPTLKPFGGFREVKPFVFCGLYPIENEDYQDLKKALERLRLNDASFEFQHDDSPVLGFGFRCGFLGLLHMEIIKERLKREYNLQVMITAPDVSYKIILKHQTKDITINNPAKLPHFSEIKKILEPYVKATVITPSQYIGAVMQLFQDKRGKFISLRYINPQRAVIIYEFPLSEMVLDFYDRLKSVTQGYASFDYQHIGYREGKLVKLNILINGKAIESLSFIIPKEQAYYKGREIAQRLRKLIPRQLFAVAIQAEVNNKVIARENVVPLKKDVIAKCYGGDVTRKRKLLEKQKEGKKRMKKIGQIEVPPEAFMEVLKINQ